MRILYIAMAHDYGQPQRGPSFEEMNFRSALEGMGHELHRFDFVERERGLGRDGMRAELVRRASDLQPDLAFCVLHEDQIDPDTIRALGAAGDCPTMNWFADDHWRFEIFTRSYAPAFDWSITTDPDALPKYAAAGIEGVIQSQWAVNRYAYGKTASGIEHGVTFVGLPHGDRRDVVAEIERAGHAVECWGAGWPNGRIGHEQMVRLFGASAINLNLSNSSVQKRTVRFRLGALARGRWADAGPAAPRPKQIKGRVFEVTGSGGFLLAESVPHLSEYFEPGREIAVFDSTEKLVEQVSYWLDRPEQRAAIAAAGHRRALEQHSYDQRFAAIFAAAGLT